MTIGMFILQEKDSLAQKSDAKIITTWKDIVEFLYMLGYAVDYTDTSGCILFDY